MERVTAAMRFQNSDSRGFRGKRVLHLISEEGGGWHFALFLVEVVLPLFRASPACKAVPRVQEVAHVLLGRELDELVRLRRKQILDDLPRGCELKP